MSMEVHIFLKKSDLPSLSAWQQTLRETDFPVGLHPTFDPIKDSGFVPTKMGELETGFEYFLSPKDEVVSSYPDLVGAVQSFDTAVTFSWGGDLAECAAALAAAAALATSSSGVMYDPQEGVLFESTGALKYANDVWEQVASALQIARF